MKEVIDFITRQSFNSPDKSVLEQMIDEYRTLHRQIKELEKQATQLKQAITTTMGEDTEARDHNGLVIATYKEYEREDFDRKGFAEACPDQYELYMKVCTYKMFSLK
jgi:predicted phage-related endonuclease